MSGSFRFVRLACVIASTTTLVACSSGTTSSNGTTSNGSSALEACSPLAGEDEPISLSNVLGAGRSVDGTIYVIDRANDYRAFVSEGSALERKKIAGSGEGPGWLIASISDGAKDFNLVVATSNGAATRMGLLEGELTSKNIDPNTAGDTLTLVDPSEYASLAVHNLAPNVVVEVDATTDDGHHLVLMRPDVDWTEQDLRFFYGTPDNMVERVITNSSRGSSIHLTVDIDGVSSDVVFPSPMLTDNAAPTMKSGGVTSSLTYRDGGLGEGLSYYCR